MRSYNESFSKNLTSTARMEHRAVLIAIEVGQVDCRLRKDRVRRRSHRVEHDIVLVRRCEGLRITIAGCFKRPLFLSSRSLSRGKV
jgi:hypothetical protein